MAAPLPWTPPVASRLEHQLAAWADGARWPSGGALGDVRWRGVETAPASAIGALVGETSSVAVAIFVAGAATPAAIAVVPWPLVIALARAAFAPRAADDPEASRRTISDELEAPRPPTAVERALVAAAIADSIARAGVDARVALDRPAMPAVPCAVVHVAVSAPRAGELAVVLPAVTPPRARLRPLAELVAARAPRLPAVAARVELARGALPASSAARLAALAAGDVIVVGPRAPALRIARGRVAGALDLAAGQLTVGAPYLRTAVNDDLADDLSIPLTVVAGEVSLSARALLELAPGAVLPLGRPLAGAVELWAGGRRVGRGELVEIDGALGVRVAELFDDPSRATPAGSRPRGD